MRNTKIFVSLVALLALAVFAASASAMGSFTEIEVNGVDAVEDGIVLAGSISAFGGQILPVRVTFDSGDVTSEDVRVKVWISGEKDYIISTERFDVLPNKTYSRVLSVQVPFDLDETEEDFNLKVVVESQNDEDVVSIVSIPLGVQRESYLVELLDVAMDNQIKAGDSLAVDIVLKNRGRHLAEDTFVRVKIPALGIERRAYFGDLSAIDQSHPDKEDAVERRMQISIPGNTPAGIYPVEIEAYNADSVTTLNKKLEVVAVGTSGHSLVVSSATSKTFAVNEEGIYSLTLVNSGTNVRVYELVVDGDSSLELSVDEPVVAIPAGTSKTVKVMAMSEKAGKYSFAVNVHSDGQLVKRESFSANVEGKTNEITGTNPTVLLTVVLAVIFIVLLVVLIVLLTRKPQKSDELGESYY